MMRDQGETARSGKTFSRTPLFFVVVVSKYLREGEASSGPLVESLHFPIALSPTKHQMGQGHPLNTIQSRYHSQLIWEETKTKHKAATTIARGPTVM